jgi:hypothetical protein
MKIQIRLVDDRGVVFEGEVTLSPSKPSKSQGKATRSTAKPAPSVDKALDFKLNAKAFMKKFGAGLSNHQRFTLLLARLVEGKTGKAIKAADVATVWNKMKPIMGGAYNAAYPTRASEKGWVNSMGKGQYVLADSWKDAIR